MIRKKLSGDSAEKNFVTRFCLLIKFVNLFLMIWRGRIIFEKREDGESLQGNQFPSF